MTVGGMGFIPERLLMMMMMIHVIIITVLHTRGARRVDVFPVVRCRGTVAPGSHMWHLETTCGHTTSQMYHLGHLGHPRGPNQPKVSSSSPCWPCFVHLAAARATAGSRGRCAADTSCVQASAALNHAAPATPALQARNEGHERPRCVGARGDAAASNCGARGGGPQATFALDALKLKKFNPQIKTVIIKI